MARTVLARVASAVAALAVCGGAYGQAGKEPPATDKGGDGLTVPSTEEQEATRHDLSYWLENMAIYHHYSIEEMVAVCGSGAEEVQKRLAELHLDQQPLTNSTGGSVLHVLPYPGGRHPRIGFLEGAVNPQRGTKASFFLPWPDAGYVVLDLPEAIFSTDGLLFLAHTHDAAPTIWSKRGIVIPNVDWRREPSPGLSHEHTLPNGVRFGAEIRPGNKQADLRLWLENNTRETLRGMRVQVCLMLKGAPDFADLSNNGKIFEAPVAAAPSKEKNRWVLIAFDRAGRIWGNDKVPCIHSDPVFPDAPPGARVEVRGQLWFYEGEGVQSEIRQAALLFHPLTAPER